VVGESGANPLPDGSGFFPLVDTRPVQIESHEQFIQPVEPMTELRLDWAAATDGSHGLQLQVSLREMPYHEPDAYSAMHVTERPPMLLLIAESHLHFGDIKARDHRRHALKMDASRQIASENFPVCRLLWTVFPPV
jgi:hypothetical protein